MLVQIASDRDQALEQARSADFSGGVEHSIPF
jgi:hypothetical protein